MNLRTLLLGVSSAALLCGFANAETLTIATVNNGDMVRMQGLTEDFTTKNPDIQLEWVTLEENVLRERVTSKGGTTEAALRAMAEHRVKEGIVAGAMAANARGGELGDLLGKDD